MPPTPTPSWVLSFYDQQQRMDLRWGLGLAHDRPISVHDHARVADLLRLCSPGGEARAADGRPLRLLELGAGSGQAAAAAAVAGLEVTAVELVPALAAVARRLAAALDAGGSAAVFGKGEALPAAGDGDKTLPASGRLLVLEGDFYAIDPGPPFDLIAYWDGFGIGTDEAQRQLLRAIHGWLAPGGKALIEVYTPWYWAAAAGRSQQLAEGTFRRYGFDADGCRMLDRWWEEGREDEAVVQSLRCYSPADLRLLLDGTGLRLEHVEPAGAWDDAAGRWEADAPLEKAQSFLARMVASED